MPTRSELDDLIARLEKATKSDNALDVEIEIAIETARGTTVRANAAGTKVIYPNPDGSEQTCWAWDWTHDAEMRRKTTEILRALPSKETDNAE